MSSWKIWVCKQNRFDAIKYFLETNIKEVEEVFFPTVLKEFCVGEKHHKRRIPLYSGYIFLKYDDPEDKIYYKIRSNPYITNYVGVCNESQVKEIREKESWNTLTKEIGIGDEIAVVAGPLKNINGIVNAINGNKVTIKVNLFDRQIDYTLSSDDLEIVKK